MKLRFKFILYLTLVIVVSVASPTSLKFDELVHKELSTPI